MSKEYKMTIAFFWEQDGDPVNEADMAELEQEALRQIAEQMEEGLICGTLRADIGEEHTPYSGRWESGSRAKEL